MALIRYAIARLLKKLKPIAQKGSTIHKTAKVCGGSQIVDTTMNRYSYCGYDCTIENARIGSFTSIGSFVKIGLAGHPLNWVSTSPAFCYGRGSVKKNFAKNAYDSAPQQTIIGNDVWIAENVLVKAGVTIGDGAVVGMGSVVTHNVGSYEIWAGNPAKMIRKRFDDSTIKELTGLQWWMMPDEELKKYSIAMPDPAKFIKLVHGREEE